MAIWVRVRQRVTTSNPTSPIARTISPSWRIVKFKAKSSPARIPMTNPTNDSIWAIMTAHNRRNTTLRCLRSLAAQTSLGWSFKQVVLVDDGSTDGTADAAREEFPGITISRQESGDLLWAGGMAVGAQIAIGKGADSLWMVNDDVELDPDALTRILETRDSWSATHSTLPWVIGSTRSPADNTTTYGGWSRKGRVIVRVHLIPAPDTPTLCATTSFNSILIPADRFRALGGFDRRFPHLRADHDLGYRATKSGDELVVIPGHIGTCESNSPSVWQRPTEPLKNRLRDVHSRKWYPPALSLRYTVRHYGVIGLASFVRPYLLIIKSHLRNRLITQQRNRRRPDVRR
jgi:GT2 family glycosyltransferase